MSIIYAYLNNELRNGQAILIFGGETSVGDPLSEFLQNGLEPTLISTQIHNHPPGFSRTHPETGESVHVPEDMGGTFGLAPSFGDLANALDGRNLIVTSKGIVMFQAAQGLSTRHRRQLANVPDDPGNNPFLIDQYMYSEAISERIDHADSQAIIRGELKDLDRMRINAFAQFGIHLKILTWEELGDQPLEEVLQRMGQELAIRASHDDFEKITATLLTAPFPSPNPLALAEAQERFTGVNEEILDFQNQLKAQMLAAAGRVGDAKRRSASESEIQTLEQKQEDLMQQWLDASSFDFARQPAEVRRLQQEREVLRNRIEWMEQFLDPKQLDQRRHRIGEWLELGRLIQATLRTHTLTDAVPSDGIIGAMAGKRIPPKDKGAATKPPAGAVNMREGEVVEFNGQMFTVGKRVDLVVRGQQIPGIILHSTTDPAAEIRVAISTLKPNVPDREEDHLPQALLSVEAAHREDIDAVFTKEDLKLLAALEILTIKTDGGMSWSEVVRGLSLRDVKQRLRELQGLVKPDLVHRVFEATADSEVAAASPGLETDMHHWLWSHTSEANVRWMRVFLKFGAPIIKGLSELPEGRFHNIQPSASNAWEVVAHVVHLATLVNDAALEGAAEDPNRLVFIQLILFGVEPDLRSVNVLFHGSPVGNIVNMIFGHGTTMIDSRMGTGDEEIAGLNFFSFDRRISEGFGFVLEFDAKALLASGVQFHVGQSIFEKELLTGEPISLRLLTPKSKRELAELLTFKRPVVNEQVAWALGYSSLTSLEKAIGPARAGGRRGDRARSLQHLKKSDVDAVIAKLPAIQADTRKERWSTDLTVHGIHQILSELPKDSAVAMAGRTLEAAERIVDLLEESKELASGIELTIGRIGLDDLVDARFLTQRFGLNPNEQRLVALVLKLIQELRRQTTAPTPAPPDKVAPKTSPQSQLDGFLKVQGLNNPFGIQEVVTALGVSAEDARRLVEADPRIVLRADGRYEQHGAMGAAGAGELSAPEPESTLDDIEQEPPPDVAEQRPKQKQESFMEKLGRLIRTQRMTERMP